MSIATRFIYYILHKMTNISNQLCILKNNEIENKNKIYFLKNNLEVFKSENISLKNDYAILYSMNKAVVDELDILKCEFIKFKNDVIQTTNNNASYIPEKLSDNKYTLNRYSCYNYLDDKLINFLKVDNFTKMTLNAVTKHIYDYIETNNLKNVIDNKLINPDENLRNLLNIERRNSILTYGNIQYYILRLLKPILN